jgi:hypothetical protein
MMGRKGKVEEALKKDIQEQKPLQGHSMGWLRTSRLRTAPSTMRSP